MPAEHLARTYYRKINAKDLEGVLGLFADDAVFSLPDGREVAGMAAIREMYIGVFGAGGPQPQPVNIIATEHSAAVEVEVHLPDARVLTMASFFTAREDGKFTRVAVYRRG